ncbi:MAG: type IX secretion system sortase PorU [Prevotella sp.]|nr:type IX secretion system sortase PorU [Prevotella sp.]
MTKQATILCFLFLMGCLKMTAQRQRFFNLTVEDVTIDSVLPTFRYAIPVGEQYADSTYELEIRYPEFIDMSKSDIERYDALTSVVPPVLPDIYQQMTVDRKRGVLEFSLMPVVERNGRRQFLVSFMVALTSRPKVVPAKGSRVRTRSASGAVTRSAEGRYAAHSVLANGRWAKIRVPASGVYQLTNDLIRRAGFTDPAKVRLYGYGGNLQNEVLTADYLSKHDDLQEVPTYSVNGKRLFYAEGPVSWSSPTATVRTRNPYSSYGYYFLTEDDAAAPVSVADSAAFLDSFYPSASDYHSLHEVDDYSWFHGGRNLFESTPLKLNAPRTFTLANKAHAAEGILTVAVTTGTYTSVVKVEANGAEIGQIRVAPGDSYDKGYEETRTFRLSNLQAVDSIRLTTLSGGPARLDYLSMTYPDAAPAPSLKSSFPAPEYVYNITNQDHHADGPVNMVIIIPTSQKLLAQAERLADFHRTHDNLTVRIVPADELYNEFSSGTPDAMAYRRYMKMLYDRATDSKDIPQSLLLFGDCVWDNRMLTADCRQLNPDDYLLAYESENSFSETDCYVNDGWFTLMDDGEGGNLLSRDKEDLGVGRFPVTTVSDAQTLVDKTISYAQNRNGGSWENVIMFMGDDGNDNLHMRDVNETAETIMAAYPGYQVRKVMWDAYTRVSSSTGNAYPEVSAIIKQQQAQGALIMDYAGHGKEDQISHEAVLRLTDYANFSNANLPLWITASCDIMPFDGTIPTIGEAAILNKKGGSMAFWGTTRTVYAYYNKAINTAFLKHVLSFTDGKPTTLGEAQRLAKCELINSSSDLTPNKLQYSLLGDPALSLNLPRLQVKVETINGMTPDAAGTIVLKGGSVVTVKGHIAKDGEKVTDFNGLLTATVRDTRELITCKKQEETSETAFQFYDRQKVLYNGSDSVRNGEFSFTFAVPRDLNYVEGTGLMHLSAVNADHSLMAHGHEDGFHINGAVEVYNDSIGPSVYCYLNTPSFVDGGNVNPTPYFVAKITDRDGINASGNGIGHDMQLTVDGKLTQTYTLNDNFRYDFGSYTSGSVGYSLPELSEGPHTLQFRAWDILNNASTVTLHFNVIKGLAPEISSISATENPARTQTTFIVTHNYIGSDVTAEIEVFDMSGRLLWRHAESGLSSGSAFATNWDLTVDGGARLHTGVYLYRVRLSSNGATKVSKAKKLIVLDNK